MDKGKADILEILELCSTYAKYQNVLLTFTFVEQRCKVSVLKSAVANSPKY